MLYALIDLPTSTRVGDVGPLPVTLRGLAAESVADLAWTGGGYDPAWVGHGFWPVVDAFATLESWQKHASSPSYVVDAGAKTVRAVYAAEAKPLAEVKAARLAALATYRYGRETGGVVVSGMSVSTDDRSKMLISGAYAAAKNNVREVFQFKGGAGFATLSKEQIAAVAEAVFTHVQDCYANEAAHAAAIEALATAAAVGTYDFTTGWPE